MRFHQYHSTIGIPPIQFGNINTRTAPYFVKMRLDFAQRCFDTKPLMCGTPCYLIFKNFINLEIFIAVRKAIICHDNYVANSTLFVFCVLVYVLVV